VIVTLPPDVDHKSKVRYGRRLAGEQSPWTTGLLLQQPL